MDRQWYIIYLLITCVNLSQQVSTPESLTYVAAVVEYPPKYVVNNSELTLKENSDAYVRCIETASLKNADIIVFPEDGLTTVNLPNRKDMEDWSTVIPAPSENYVPCAQTTTGVSETLRKISCAAKNFNIYVVINIAERLPCTENICPSDKTFYYNSNVVFDRTGKIIARYRKTNLFVEPQFNVTAVPEIIIFNTDFGVKFGTFICFDILFHEPALQLTRQYHVTDIVFTTAWFSESPFLTAVQTQAGWSFAEDVNLLAAGYNRPASGNAGSGIYLGRKGIGKAIMPQSQHEEILIFEVPKIKEGNRSNRYRGHSMNNHSTTSPSYHDPKGYVRDELRKKQGDNKTTANNAIFLLRDNIDAFQTEALQGNRTRTICQNDFCCEFKVEMAKVDPKTMYRLVVFNGVRRYSVVPVGVRVCAVIQCSNNSLPSCGSVDESETIFNSIEITAKFDDYKNILIMPSSLNPSLLPLGNWTFDEHTHDNHAHVTISLNASTNDLVAFGIYSRNFDKDHVNMAASFNAINYFVALLTAILLSKL